MWLVYIVSGVELSTNLPIIGADTYYYINYNRHRSDVRMCDLYRVILLLIY